MGGDSGSGPNPHCPRAYAIHDMETFLADVEPSSDTPTVNTQIAHQAANPYEVLLGNSVEHLSLDNISFTMPNHDDLFIFDRHCSEPDATC